MEDKKYKREYRELKPETIAKLRSNQTLRQPKSDLHKQHISQGLKRYWDGVPSKPKEDLSMDDYLSGKEA